MEWDISASDPAGNTLVKDDNVTSVPALKFVVFDNFSFTADTTSPLLDNLSIVASKVENAFAYDNHSRHVLKAGDNLTLTFTTNENIDNTSLGTILQIDLIIGLLY